MVLDDCCFADGCAVLFRCLLDDAGKGDHYNHARQSVLNGVVESESQ